MATLGFALPVTTWGGGAGAAVPVVAPSVPLMVGLPATAGMPARAVVPLCGPLSQRLGRATLAFVLGTFGVLAGLAAYGEGVDLGSAGTRFALTGAPCAVVAAARAPFRPPGWPAAASSARDTVQPRGRGGQRLSRPYTPAGR